MISRRSALRTVGTGLASAALAGRAATEPEWTVEETPTENTLHDVVYTSEGAYAVGGDGLILERADEGWRTVTDGGVSGNGDNLRGAGVTDDGDRLWVVGASGAIGEFDPASGSLTDRSAPQDNTNNFLDVAVTCEAGNANVYVADASGIVSYSFDNGRSETWESVQIGQGNGLPGIDFYDVRSGHVLNTNASVFETTDGSTYERIGVPDADNSLYGIDSDGSNDVWAVGGGGTVQRYTGRWERTDLGNLTLRDVDVEDGAGYTVGESGRVFEFTGTWEEDTTETEQNLRGLALGAPNVAVGDSGTAIVKDNPGGTSPI